MTGVTNPKTFTITDANVAQDQVTSFLILLGQQSGGPYTLSAAADLAALSVNGDQITGTFDQLHQQLAPGQWFGVVQAVNNSGKTSDNSPEVAFVIEAPKPSAPSGFTVA